MRAYHRHNYDVVVNQTWYSVFGTSASAPTWAAMIAAVNDARIAAGKKTVGWANPAVRLSLRPALRVALTLDWSSLAVLEGVLGCLQRHHRGQQLRVRAARQFGVRRCAGMGSCNWAGDAQFQEAARCMDGASVNCALDLVTYAHVHSLSGK